jgi:uncharacterized membrane protein
MPPHVFALVLASAGMHAAWNAMLRHSEERFRTLVIMCLTGCVISLPFVFFLPFPPAAAWPYIGLSVGLHIGYSLFLIHAYKHGELSQVYPIARGSSPLLVTLGAALFAHEQLTLLSTLGVMLISGGILSLAHPKSGATRLSLFTALGCGAFIASYTVVDGMGARLTGEALSYSAWLFVLYDLAMVGIYRFQKGKLRVKFRDPKARRAVIGGVISLLAYVIVIWAMTLGPMGPVSALRETSVVFAVLIGWFFLKEKLTFQRLMACIVIAIGGVCLA